MRPEQPWTVCTQRREGNLTCSLRVHLVATNHESVKKVPDLGSVFHVESAFAVECGKMTGVKDNM